MHFIELSEKETSKINSPIQPLQEQIVPKTSLVSLWKPEFIHDSFLLNTLHVMLIHKFTFFVVSTEKKAMFGAINEYFFQILSKVSSSPLFNSNMKYLKI